MSMPLRASLASFLVLLFQSGLWAQFPASGVNLMSRVGPDDFTPMQTWGNKLWGYTSPAGREYAIVGLQHGTGFVEVTDPGRPNIVGLIDGPDSGWRAMKAYMDHAYIVSEGGGGIQVVDLTQIDSGTIMLVNSVLTPDPTNTHNLAIDEVSGFLYRIDFFNGPGLRFYDLADPANPAFVGMWADEMVHDAQVITYTTGPYAGREIAFACTPELVDSLSIIDVTDKANAVLLSEVTYPNNTLSHQVALSEDRQWAFLKRRDCPPARSAFDRLRLRRLRHRQSRLRHIFHERQHGGHQGQRREGELPVLLQSDQRSAHLRHFRPPERRRNRLLRYLALRQRSHTAQPAGQLPAVSERCRHR